MVAGMCCAPLPRPGHQRSLDAVEPASRLLPGACPRREETLTQLFLSSVRRGKEVEAVLAAKALGLHVTTLGASAATEAIYQEVCVCVCVCWSQGGVGLGKGWVGGWGGGFGSVRGRRGWEGSKGTNLAPAGGARHGVDPARLPGTRQTLLARSNVCRTPARP